MFVMIRTPSVISSSSLAMFFDIHPNVPLYDAMSYLRTGKLSISPNCEATISDQNSAGNSLTIFPLTIFFKDVLK